jgi:Protein of unknown function (DUF1638)
MRLKAIVCQVFTRETQLAVSRSPHQVDAEILPIGMHELGEQMRFQLQHRIDVADGQGYDVIVLGFALCGRGTEGLRAGKTPIVMPRAHDCIDVLMGGHSKSMAYFETHPGVYYSSPGWVEFLEASNALQPASMKNVFGDRRPLTELIARYGEEGGRYLHAGFGAGQQEETLTYISTGVPGEDEFRRDARAEAEETNRHFRECSGSTEVLERLVSGAWATEEFLIIPPGSSVRAVLGAAIVDLS